MATKKKTIKSYKSTTKTIVTPDGKTHKVKIGSAADKKYSTQISAPTIKTSTPISSSFSSANLKSGSSGNEVKTLQQALNARGANLVVDGKYGPKTEAAVRAFQKSSNIANDGIAGPITKGRLYGQNLATSEEVAQDQEDVALQEALGQDPAMKAIYDTLNLQIQMAKEQGQRVNPDLTITPEMTARFISEATSKLDPYYQELIRQKKEDIGTSIQRLQEDYNTQIQREEPAFQQTLESQDINEAEQGLAFSSGRVQREQNIISDQQNRLTDLQSTTQRSAEDLGVSGERTLGSRAFADLGIPTLQSYIAGRGTIAPRGQLAPKGSRNLYNPLGNISGSMPWERETGIKTEVGNLKDQEIKKRILNTGYGLGNTSLG